MKDGTILIVLDEEPDKLYKYIPLNHNGCHNCAFQETVCGSLFDGRCSDFFKAVSGKKRGCFMEVK